MLKNLTVQNYALINQLRISFHQGLTTITGETGAGKSILLGALGLIIGNRADMSALNDKQKSCVVEGEFDISTYNLKVFFQQNDLDYDDTTIIRRQINPAGKSRAFVNEIPVTLPVLKDLVGRIIDIHSQHQNLFLSDTSFQLGVLDAYTSNSNLLASYRIAYKKYKNIKAQYEDLLSNAQQAKADSDYLTFQLKQLEDAKLKLGEEHELQTLQQQLSHAEEIKTALQNVSSYLNAEDTSVLVWLKDAVTLLERITNVFPQSEELAKRLESCRIELHDIAREVDLNNEKVELDPNQLEAVTQRLDSIFTLQQKHRVQTVEELIGIRDNLRVKLDQIANYDTSVEELKKQLDIAENEAIALAKKISKARIDGIESFQIKVKHLLTQLGMQHAEFKVEQTVLKELGSTGIDRVIFLFSANRQIAVQELSKVASGGELSRLMLSLKSIMAKTIGLPTIILDEIDTGVSGEVADKVGNIINEMSRGMQVINITHLPQIASKGQHHLLVYKQQDDGIAKTLIKPLGAQERVQEIAKMLSGEKISDAALINAKHLLDTNSS